MKRYAQIFKNRTFPLMTLLALATLALGYYLFHVRGREDYFTHRYLRLLAFESGRIEERLATLDGVFTNYQKDDTLTAADLADLKDLPSLERLEPPPADFQVADEGVTRQGRIEDDQFRIYAGWKQRKTIGSGKAGQGTGGKEKDSEDVVFRFDPFALAQPDLPEDFETLFVASRDGTVLYQTTQNGGRQLRIVSVKKLLGGDGKELDLAAFARSTSILDVRFAGEPYKLFLRPCCRTIWEAPREPPPQSKEGPPAKAARASDASSLEWVVGGAVRSSTLSAQCWAISFTVGIFVVSLFVLALLSLSFLRVLAIGPKEKLRVADAQWVGFTAIMGVGLLTLLLVDLHAYRALIDGTDERLAALAVEIRKNLNLELGAAWKQLNEFNGRVEAKIRETGKGKPAEVTSCGDLRKAGIEPRRALLAGKLPHAAFSYSDFERFTWTDSTGRQCFKWALDWPGDPLVRDVRKRRYFQDAMEGQEAIEPVFSLASGKRVAVLAKPTRSAKSSFVGVLGIELSSLNGPVLPPGYGFAVIDDETGDVLFHSDPGRGGYENFFEEADHDRGLRALVAARRTGTQNTAYMGRGHRLRVEPIVPPGSAAGSWLRQPPFWTLIVFSDKRDMRTFNVDAMTTAMLFLVLYLLVYMVGCGLLRAVKRHYRAGWLWPEKQGEPRERVHLVLTVFYLLCLVLSLVAIRLLDGIDLLWFAFAFPWAVLVVSYRLCTGRISAARRFVLGSFLAVLLLLIYLSPGSRPEGPLQLAPLLEPARSFLLAFISLLLWGCFSVPPAALRSVADSPRRTYLAAASLLLALTAAVPAAAFFCVAHRAHLETRIKRGQLGLALGHEQRDERLKQHYAAARAPLLYSRLKQSWDLYGCFFFGTTAGESCEELRSQGERPMLHVAKAALLPALETAKASGERHQHCVILPHFIQAALPLYTEDFIRVRRLIEDHDGSQNGAWDWDHAEQGTLTFERARGRLTSTIPRVSLAGFPMLWPISLLFLVGTIAGVARFVARKFFLYGLPTPEAGDPMSVASASTRNFILVSPHIDEMAQRLAGQKVALIDLRELASREDLLRCLGRADLVASPRICLHHFEHRLQEEEHNLLKLGLMEELILGRDKPVIILSHVVPAWYLLDRKPAAEAEDGTLDPDKATKRLEAVEKARKEIQERWRGLLRRFLTWVCRNRANVHRLNSDLSAIQSAHVLPDGALNVRRLQRLLAMAREECGESEQLESLAGDLVKARLQDLSRDLFLDDLKERAEPYYRALWTMCTEEEKVVLVHLAEGGLINAKNAVALKMLMRRGLVRRDPSFRLMNESFRRFVATDICLVEVRTLEQEAGTSAWGRMKGPLTVTLIGVAAFFFFTQREAFDVSIAFLSAIAASLPALFRVFGAAGSGQGKAAT